MGLDLSTGRVWAVECIGKSSKCKLEFIRKSWRIESPFARSVITRSFKLRGRAGGVSWPVAIGGGAEGWEGRLCM